MMCVLVQQQPRCPVIVSLQSIENVPLHLECVTQGDRVYQEYFGLRTEHKLPLNDSTYFDPANSE